MIRELELDGDVMLVEHSGSVGVLVAALSSAPRSLWLQSAAENTQFDDSAKLWQLANYTKYLYGPTLLCFFARLDAALQYLCMYGEHASMHVDLALLRAARHVVFIFRPSTYGTSYVADPKP